MEYIGPFAFNGIRFLLGSLSLLPLLFLKNSNSSGVRKLKPVIITGICLFTAVSLQQIGIMFTSAGNAGFITGLYVVLVPVLGIFWHRKTKNTTWIGMVFTLAGLFLIAGMNTGTGKINPGDIFVAGSAVFWAFHVLLIDKYAEKCGPLFLSSGQFAVCGILSLLIAFPAEPFLTRLLASAEWIPLNGLLSAMINGNILPDFAKGALIPVLYGGLASVGIAYTMQVVAQQYAPPAHAVIILSLEGSFAALGGMLILKETFSVKTIIGFALMFAGMLVSQLGLLYQTKNLNASQVR